jgi:signal transduction histidine kinase
VSRTLRGRLARTLGLTAGVSVAVTALIAFGLVRRYADQSTMRELAAHADAVAREASSIELGKAPALRRLLASSGDLIGLVGPRGAVRSEDPDVLGVAAAVDLAPMLAGRRIQGTVRTGAGTFAYVALPARGPRGLNAGILLARPVGLARDVWAPVVLRVLLAGGLAVAAAVFVSGFVARAFTRPVRRVSDATADVAAGDLSQRVPVEGDDEIAELARRFNAMADALGEARRREHEFLASVSHELRTPITAIRGYAEAIADGAARQGEEMDDAVAVIRDEASRLERLVQDVIDLARLGAREFRLHPVEVDLAPTLRDAVKAHAPRAADAGVDLGVDVRDGLVATTDPGRVRQILENLLENALRVTPDGGAVRVAGAPERSGVSLEVSDTGPGINPADLPHVFERSYLWGVSRGVREVGTGLGLAIVRELATALGGRLEVRSDPGRGTTFRLILPARAPQPVNA